MSTPAQAFTVTEILKEELSARGWSESDLIARIGSTDPVDVCAVEMVAVCDYATWQMGLRLGASTARLLENATGISSQFWLNIDDAYHSWFKASKESPNAHT